jgi:hypothetical protein
LQLASAGRRALGRLHLAPAPGPAPAARAAPAPTKPPAAPRCCLQPSQDGVNYNLLILLHGLGDRPGPFARLAQQLALPQTASLALPGPAEVPETDGGRAWHTAFDGDWELLQVRWGLEGRGGRGGLGGLGAWGASGAGLRRPLQPAPGLRPAPCLHRAQALPRSHSARVLPSSPGPPVRRPRRAASAG